MVWWLPVNGVWRSNSELHRPLMFEQLLADSNALVLKWHGVLARCSATITLIERSRRGWAGQAQSVVRVRWVRACAVRWARRGGCHGQYSIWIIDYVTAWARPLLVEKQAKGDRTLNGETWFKLNWKSPVIIEDGGRVTYYLQKSWWLFTNDPKLNDGDEWAWGGAVCLRKRLVDWENVLPRNPALY